MDIKHYGTPRHSGRYEWGSGKDPHQRNTSLLGQIDDLKKKGLSETEIAKGLGLSTTQLRTKKALALEEMRKQSVAEAVKLKDKGYSNVAIGKKMGIGESSVRSLLNPVLEERAKITTATSNVLKDAVDSGKYIDIGTGVETHMGISRTKLNSAIAKLKEEEGYTVHYVKVLQVGTGKYTTMKVLAKPDVTYSEVFKNKEDIKNVGGFSEDGGQTFSKIEPIRSISSKRINIRYSEDGGSDKDGVIELRRGVDDISLGTSKYAQVRIGVDGKKYLKGMAMYSDDMPDGVDIIFNTNKSKKVPKDEVLKDMKNDPDNPFGATIRQKHYIDKNGKKQLSSLNIVNEEGDWESWSKKLSSQFLSKQSPTLAKKQLDLSLAIKNDELAEIMSLTNPVIKKKLLTAFADDCDSASVHLKAAGMPRQASKVLLPFPKMKETEVYAPTFKNGEKVVLIRYPHGGIFEIPELTVNNKFADAKRLMRNAKDAIGISPKVAARLSGADFDGDTVLVIPNRNKSIKYSSPLQGLKDFNPQEKYKAYAGMPKMSSKTKAIKMGDVSNLITDMTIKGATDNEICRAVRHSMVVIDAEKHHLNYKQSYLDNGIAGLKQKYQGSARAGASTLISRASSEKRVLERKEKKSNPLTGEKVYEYTNASYINKFGKKVLKTVRSSKMAETKDARTLSSGTMIEDIYAGYANKLKAMANSARKKAFSIKNMIYSPSAKKIYSKEVTSIMDKLKIIKKNKPIERAAQLLANKIIKAKKQANPNMDLDDLKKIKGMALENARSRVGAKKTNITITKREWEAIQAGAISNNTLSSLLDGIDLDIVKELATPRASTSISSSKKKRANAMAASGYTQAEIAEALGISASSVSSILE